MNYQRVVLVFCSLAVVSLTMMGCTGVRSQVIDVTPTNITADGTTVQYTTSDGNSSSGVFAISASQVKASSGIPVAYVNIWVASEFFDDQNPPQFIIQQNEIPVPSETNTNATLNYFVKKAEGGSMTLMQLVAPLSPNQITYVGVYFGYTGGNGGNSTNTNGGNGTNTNGGNSTNTNGGNSTDTNGGNSTNTNGGNSTNTNGGNSTNTNGGNSTNTSGGNSTSANSTSINSKFNAVVGPVTFNISAWITSDREVPLPTTDLTSPIGGGLQAGQFQYFHFNLTIAKAQGLYVAVTANSASAAGLQVFLSVDKYATLDDFEFESTFTKQYATNYVTYALLSDDQLPRSGHFYVLVYSQTSALDFTLVCQAPTETSLKVGVNSTWSIGKNAFSISSIELPATVLSGVSPLVLQFNTPSAAAAFNTKIYVAYERLATQYDFDYSLSAADNANSTASSSRYLIIPDSELKSGSWFIATYINGAAIQVSSIVSLPGDASISISNTADSPVTTEIGPNLWGVFHFNPQSISNTTSTKQFLQFDVVSSSAVQSMASTQSTTFVVYGRYGAVPTPLSYDTISLIDSNGDTVLCTNTKTFVSSSNSSYYVAIVNQASTTQQFSVSVTNTDECPSPKSGSKVAITIIVIIIVVASVIAGAAYVLRMRQKRKPVVDEGVPDYRLLQPHPV